MSKQTYDVLIDIDDVLYPWSTTAHMICERAGITNGRPVTEWDMGKCYGVPNELVWEVLGEAILSGELHGQAWDARAVAQLARLRGYGHRVHIVTARGFGQHGDLIEAETRRQIRELNVPLDSLTFTKDKTTVECDFALDDGIHNFEALTEAGVETYLMDAQHNRHYSTINRVHYMEDFADIVLANAALSVQVRDAA